MDSGLPGGIAADALDDFYAECDEHLKAIRAGLIRLESTGSGRPDEGTVQALYRSTHSLKGICAIVGLREAEASAHAMEDAFRLMTKGLATPGSDLVDALLGVATHVERVVAGFRSGKAAQPAPEIKERLKSLLPSRDVESAQRNTPVQKGPHSAEAAEASGPGLYVAVFSPSKELTNRGINITVVKERLSAIGDILESKPVVKGRGLVQFRFTVAVKAPIGSSASWADSGVTFEKQHPAPSPEEDASELAGLTPSRIVRVDLGKLDELMRIAGEMVIHRSRLEERLRQDGALEGAREALLGLGRSLREMREAISSARMVPVGEIFDRIPYLVRDLARATDKKARVALEGNQTEVDKFLVERLREPVLHLVRNCFAHGVEPAAERKAAGKPAEALILLRASSAGDSVFIQVSDDGRGVDADTVFARAAAMGLAVPEDSDPKSLLDVLCSPGFSSRDTADMSAGRGIGMTVVAAAARELGGSLSMRSTKGKGTEFTLRLPLSISICDAVILNVGGAKFTMNKGAIHEIVQAESGAIRSVSSTELVPYREGMLPLVRLRAALAMAPSSAPKLVIVVAGTSRGPVGFVADSVVAQREIVVRPLSDPFLRVPGISGVTELGDGRPVLVLDPETLNSAQAARPAPES